MLKRFLILIITALSFFGAAFSQNEEFVPVIDYNTPKAYIVDQIIISGVQYLDKAVLESMSGLQKGQVINVPGDEVSFIIKKYWDNGLFSDIKFYLTNVRGDTADIEIYLKERPRISKFSLTGPSSSDRKELLEKLKIRPGNQLTDDLLNTADIVIKKFYWEKGYFNTQVDVIQVPDTAVQGNRVQLTLDVKKKKRVKISNITFTGNEAFRDSRLRRAFKKTHRRDWNIFKSAKYIQNNYNEDKKLLIDFYNERGYRDAKIVADSMVVLSPKRVHLFITVEEGKKYYFRDIRWIGNSVYHSTILDATLGIKKGDVFNQKTLNKRLSEDEDAVSALYLDHGYLFYNLDPVEVRIENDSIDFEMRINEGKQATINNVIISGNTKTNEHVVRREIRTLPGELFSRQEIIRTVRELATLGHFDPEKIQPQPIPNPAEGTVDLKYQLEERANDQLEVSGGYGGGLVIGTIGVRFSNFSARNMFNLKAWRPIPSGDGQTLSIRAQTSGRIYRSYNLSFIEPWFGGKKPNSLSVSFFHSSMSPSLYWGFNEKSDKYMRITGASVGLGRRLKFPDDYFTLYNEISFQRYNLNEYNPYGFVFDKGISNSFSFKTVIGRNSVDQPIYPRKGSSFSLSLQLTPPYSIINNSDYKSKSVAEKYKWIEYHKWVFKSEYYFNIIDKLVLATMAQFGGLGYYNSKIGFSPFEGFDMGGDGMSGYILYGKDLVSMRGYTSSSLTPRVDANNNVVYDNSSSFRSANLYDKFTMELRYPLTLSPSATVYFLTFVEGGNAWYNRDTFNPFDLRRSAGVGLRAFLPMFGLLGIDWGYGFDDIPGQSGANKSQFSFILGQQF